MQTKNLTKFKVGDEVTVVNWNVLPQRDGLESPKIGSSFTIAKVQDCSDHIGRYSQVCFAEGMHGIFNSELELSIIHESPLMKALA